MWDKHLESSFLWTASVMEQMARGPPTPCPMLLFCPGILSSLGGGRGGVLALAFWSCSTGAWLHSLACKPAQQPQARGNSAAGRSRPPGSEL